MRTVHCEDALTWLGRHAPVPNSSVVTSLPDWSEFPGQPLSTYRSWFREAAGAVMRGCPEEGACIFYQTDLKPEGAWLDKGYLCQQAAEDAGLALLWHKVVCRAPAGTVTCGRPAWSHLLCFSRRLRLRPERSLMDVLPEGGERSWVRGMGLATCRLVCRFLREQTESRVLVAPFCGHGLLLAVAEEAGLEAIGIELSAKRARKARLAEVPR